MKTKNVVFFMLIFSISSWNLSASVVHVYLDDTFSPEYHYFCGVDSVIVHASSIAANNFYWNPPVGPNVYDVDSVIVTSINTGGWFFYSDEIDKDFYIYILTSPPTEPACMVTDTSFSTDNFSLPLDAQNHLPGGYASTYLWSTGETTRTIIATTPGVYSVTITNECGSNVFSINVDVTQTHLPGDELTPDSWHYFCGNENDSIIVHAPENAATNMYFRNETTLEEYETDSAVITMENMGSWSFYSLETGGFYFSIYIVSALPYEPGNFEDLHICTFNFARILDAQNTEEGASYLWSTGETTQTISVDAPGIYTVAITNTCGDGVFSKTITQGNPNAPNLGPDQEFCFGETTTLDPQSTDVIYTLWSTGSTDPQLIVGESGDYWVHVEDANGCNGRDTINIVVNQPISMEMHDVSFDTTTNKTILRWCVELGSEITHVRGEVKNEFGIWTEIETVPYETGYIIHWESMPQGIAYEYRLVVISECGESNPSTVHKSIWLTQLNEELQWQNYYGTFVPTYYTIFARMTNNTITQLGNIAACSTGEGCLNHFPITTNPDITKYFVGFEHNCGAKDGVQYVFSNYYDPISGVATTEIINFSIYPNPATDQLGISINDDTFEVKIFNMLSENVLSETNVKTLDISTLAKGMYTLQLRTPDGISIKKFIKQ